MAKIVKEAFRKPFSVAAQSGGSASADAAAVPLVDGRADDHTEKIRQTSGAAGIYGIICAKRRTFQRVLTLSGLVHSGSITPVLQA